MAEDPGLTEVLCEKIDITSNCNANLNVNAADTKEDKKKAAAAEKVKRRLSHEPKQRWGKAIVGVRSAKRQQLRRKMTMVENDPFLERFTVTGRAFSQEHAPTIYLIEDIFTCKFWKEVVVDPSGLNYYYWCTFVMMAVLYNVIAVICRCVFDQPNHDWYLKMFMAMDYTADAIYLFDMFMKSRIGFLEQGLLVKDVKRLTKLYGTSSRCLFDTISILPLDFFYFLYGIKPAFRLNRNFKIARLVQFFHMAETHTNYPNLIRVSNLVLYIIIIIHWNACFYFAISRGIGFGTDTWVYPNTDDPVFAGFWIQYLTSFYWSCLTLTTIGDTNFPITPIEHFYCISCSLMGVLIFATIFGNVGAMINHMDAARTDFQYKVDTVKRHMELRGIGMELQKRVINWFDYTWNNKQSIDDRESLEYLPEKLRAEISIHVHMQTLRRVAIFQDCEPGLLVELVLKLRLQVFSPGDYICRKGDIGKSMYIIKRGKLQVVSEDGKIVFVTLTDGAVFGEVSILNIAGNKTGNRRTAGVKSVGYSDLFCLSKNDLWDALTEYPEAKKMLNETGKKILRKDNLLDEEAARREEKRQQAMVLKIEAIVDSVDDIQQKLRILTEKLDEKHSGRRVSAVGLDTLVDNLEAPEQPIAIAIKMSTSALRHENTTPSPIPEDDEEES